MALLEFYQRLIQVFSDVGQEFRARIKAVVAEINRTHDVDSLCRELPGRVQQVKAAEGGRISK